MKPTPEQIAKLPAWARSYIEDLERQRFVAVRELNEYTDSQTASPFFTEDSLCTGEQSGPTRRTRYIQAHSICVNWSGVALRIDANEYGNQGPGIRLSWLGSDERSEVALIPSSYMQARLVSAVDMRKEDGK